MSTELRELHNYTRGSPVTLTDPNGLEVPSPEREKELGIAPLPPEQPRDDRFTAEGVGKGALNSLLDRFADVSKGLMIAVAPLGGHRVTSEAPQTPVLQAVQQVDMAIEEGNYKDVSPSEEFAGAIAVFAAELALGAALGKLAAPRALVGPAATHASPPSSPSGPSGPVGRVLDWLGEWRAPHADKRALTPAGLTVEVPDMRPVAGRQSLSVLGETVGGKTPRSPGELPHPVIELGPVTAEVRQLKKFFMKEGHGEAFGLTGKWSQERVGETLGVIEGHLTNPNVLRLGGSYRGKPAVFHLDPETGLNVVMSPSGEFVTGYQLDAAQQAGLIFRGELW